MMINMPRRRGRPRGISYSRPESKVLEYLAIVSAKHAIGMNEFFSTIVHAWEHDTARCRELTIQCRKRKNGHAVILITSESTVIAQFSIPERLLEEVNPLQRFVSKWQQIKDVIEKKRRNEVPHHVRIGDLKSGMDKVSIRAQVVKISKPKLLLTRLNDYALLTNVTISDETGTITLPLWNDRISAVSINDEVQIENGKVTTFRGERQLRIGRNGTLKVVEDESSNPPKHNVKFMANCVSHL